MPRLIVLHGYTMNAAVMRKHLGGLVEELEREVELDFVEAPHVCSEATVDRLFGIWRTPRTEPPYLMWWNATDDGRVYRGWETTCERLRAAMGSGDVGLLGFSQGATVSGVITALAERGEMPSVRFAVLVAGRVPRAEVFQPLFEGSLRTPSLHAWGTADTVAPNLPEKLASKFGPVSREIVVWAGGHRVPTRGEGADAIVRFVRERATGSSGVGDG